MRGSTLFDDSTWVNPDVEPAPSFSIWQSRPSVSSHTGGLSSPSWFGFKSQWPCTLPSISSPQCRARGGWEPAPRSTRTHTEVHPIQVHPEINLHKKCTYLSSPGVRSSVFSFGPPLPYPKRHFCNSMQASELCQKVLVSLKAEPSFKVGASSMGSTFPSAGTRNENFFPRTRGGRFQYSHASMKPLNQFIKCKGQVRERFYSAFTRSSDGPFSKYFGSHSANFTVILSFQQHGRYNEEVLQFIASPDLFSGVTLITLLTTPLV